jgi:predicted CopG family antitoxin
MYADRIHVSTSIRVSDDTKRMLERLKRDDETFDELLERLVQNEEPIEIGAWSEEEAERARCREAVPGEFRAVTFLDSSVIIDMLEGVPDVVEAVEERGQPYLTSSLCVFEVVDGRVGSGETDVVAVRQQFGGVRAL